MDLHQLCALKDGDVVMYHDVRVTIEKVLRLEEGIPVALIVYIGKRDDPDPQFREVLCACGDGTVTPDGEALSRVN